MESLKEHRIEVGLTQAELARLAGVRQATISDIERGKRVPRFSTMQRLIEVIAGRLK